MPHRRFGGRICRSRWAGHPGDLAAHRHLRRPPPPDHAAIRVNGLTGKASDYKLYAKGTDGQYHAFTGSWSLENASGRLRAQKVYEIRFTLQDGGDFDLSTDAKEVTAAILLAR